MLRYQSEWTQEEVAVRLGLSIPAYSKIETGASDISLSRLEQLAAVFDLSVIQLLMLDEKADQEFAGEIAALKLLMDVRRKELIGLQRKVIELYEELRMEEVGELNF